MIKDGPPVGLTGRSLVKKLAPLAVGSGSIALMYLSFEWAIGAIIHNRPIVMVPDLNGKGVAEALNSVSQAHLGLMKEAEQYDKRFPAGSVIRQSPRPGMPVREGRLIKIVLSQGGETLFVPDLTAQPLRNAQTALQNLGLNIGEIERRPSLKFEKEQVIATDPPQGAVVAKNALVNLVLSDGPPGSDVLLAPDFAGKGLKEAKGWTSSHQVGLVIQEEVDINKAPEEILLQSPAPDLPIHAGDTLTVVVNSAAGAAAGSPANQTGPRVHFEVPQGANDRDIRILVMDESGEREVFRKSEPPGSKIDFPVTLKGRGRARILVNGIQVEEQLLQ